MYRIVLLMLVEEVRKRVIDVVTNLRPPVNIAGSFKEVEITLGEVRCISEYIGILLQLVYHRDHIVICKILCTCCCKYEIFVLLESGISCCIADLTCAVPAMT